MSDLEKQLTYLKLSYMFENYDSVATTAAQKKWTHVEYLSEMVKHESNLRNDKLIQRRIKSARFPVIKTLDQFNWSWPKKINPTQIKNFSGLRT